MLAFMMKSACGPKGASYVSDNIKVTDELLKTEYG